MLRFGTRLLTLTVTLSYFSVTPTYTQCGHSYTTLYKTSTHMSNYTINTSYIQPFSAGAHGRTDNEQIKKSKRGSPAEVSVTC